MKKVLIILGILAGAVLIIAAGIFLRTRFAAQTESAPSGNEEVVGGLPEGTGGGYSETAGGSAAQGTASLGGLTALTDSTIYDYAVVGEDIRYVRKDGQIVRIGASSSTILSSTKVRDLLDARFSFDGKKVLFKAGLVQSPRWSLYDVEKNSWRQLTIEARDVSWSPKDNRLAYAARKTYTSVITILNTESASARPINLLTLNAEELDVVWGDASTIYFGERGDAGVPGSLWKYDLKINTAQKVRDGIYGADLAWGSKDQGLLFHGKAGGRSGDLELVNRNLQNAQMLSFLTLPSKCAFYMASSSENLLCAIPKDARRMQEAALPNDYEKYSVGGNDDIFSVNLQSGTFRQIVWSQDLTADAIRLKAAAGYLYFVNRADGRLYKLKLPA